MLTLPVELSEGKLRDVKEENGCEAKDGEVPEEVTLAKNLLKERLETFHIPARVKKTAYVQLPLPLFSQSPLPS